MISVIPEKFSIKLNRNELEHLQNFFENNASQIELQKDTKTGSTVQALAKKLDLLINSGYFRGTN